MEEGKLRAIGRSGKSTRVFAKQGDLDGSCAIYSLMMMLIFHKKLDWEDLVDIERAEENDFVYIIQIQFLYDFNGICLGGHVMDDLSDKLNECYERKLSEVFTTHKGKYNSVSRRYLHLKIKAQLDARKPVMLGYWGETEKGHAVVAIGYQKVRNKLLLFCLDPARPLSFVQIWNNVIGLDYLSCDSNALTDINHYEGKKVCVTKIMIINDNPPELDCPF
ncbi:MAG: hypothetical protein IKW91_10960 [Bacteroidaceae bacterium]|nr:hypothetical protein [Bacteroidaceae bacterium]